MTKILRITSAVGVGLVFFLLVSLFALSHLIRIREFRRFLVDEIESRTQWVVTAGEAELHLGREIGLSILDFALWEKDGTAPLIRAERVLVRIALLPLLERRIVFDEIRFYGPEIKIGGAPGSKMPLLDLMAALPSQKTEEAQFALAVHKIRVERGRILFSSPGRDEGSTPPQLREIELSFRRIEAEEVPRSATQFLTDALALEYSLKTTIEKGASRAGLTSEGMILFPKGASQLRQLWLDARVEVTSLPVDLLRGYYGSFLPPGGVTGILNPSFHWQGKLAGRVRIEGEVNFRQLEVRAPDLFADVLAPGDGRLELKVELLPGEILFRRLDLRTNDISLSARGSVRSLAEKDPYLEIHLTTPFLSLLTLRNYVPRRVFDSQPWKYLARAVKQGEVRLTKAGVAGHLSEIRHLFKPGFEDRLWLYAEVRELGGNLAGDPGIPVNGVSGRIDLEKGVLTYRGFKGTYGMTLFEEIEGSQTGVFTDQSLLEIRAKGEADLRGLWNQWSSKLLPPDLINVDDDGRGVDGKGRFKFLYRTDFESSHHYEGQLSLENADVQIGGVSFSEVHGDLSFSPAEIRSNNVSALFAGSPIRMGLTLKNYLSGDPTVDFRVDSPGIKAGELSRIILSTGPPGVSGTIRGKLRYQGSLASTRKGALSGSLELAGVQLSVPFVSRPLREVSGKLSFVQGGIDLRDFQGQVENYEFDFNGRWRYREGPELTFIFTAPEMDLALLLTPGDAEINDRSDHLWAEGKISIDKGRLEGFEFIDLQTDLTLKGRRWFFDNFSARSQGGTIEGGGSFMDTPEELSFSVKPRIRGVPVNSFLGWFDIGTRELTGNITLDGMVEARGKTGDEIEEHLNGTFKVEIKDGLLRRAKTLARVLSLMDLSKWFTLRMPDISREGIRFRRISGDIKVSQGVYSTQNLVLDSDDLRITGAGQLDVPRGELSFVVAVRPFPRVDSAVSYIPLIGTGIAGIKNSLLVASFNVKGPIDDPTITPAPLSTLSEFFFGALAIPKSLIPFKGQKRE